MVERIPRRARGRRFRAVFITVVTVFVISISTIVGFFTDLLWFKEVGFKEVFLKTLYSKLGLAFGFGAFFFIFCLINLAIVARTMPSYRVHDPSDPIERYRATFLPYLRWLAIGGSAFLAVMFALSAAPEWQKFLLAQKGGLFGTVDQVFKQDIGFYVFRLPAYQFVYGWLFSTLVIITLIVAGAHYMTGGIRPQARVDRVTAHVKAHLSVLIGLIALLRAWGYRLDQFKLLYSTRGDVTGASYTDINAELPALKLLVIISVIAAVLFLVNIRFRGWALPLAGVGLWFLTSVLAAGAFPFVVQSFKVNPSQFQKEQKFIARNIAATRAAYGVDKMDVKEYPVETGLSAESLNSNPATVDNIRLFDPTILKTAYRQLQEIRTYYEFNDVDVDRYKIASRERQVMLSVRELALANLESSSWQNNHVFYTHGYGAVVSPTNKTSTEGQPQFLVKDIPPKAEDADLNIDQPSIYYGERSNDYSLVKTKQKELDFEQQEGNKLVSYQGKGGVEESPLIRRLAFAWRFRNVNLLISGLIQPDTKIIYNRQIKERLGKAAPFLSFDGDPYPVIVDGRIVWIADAYTTTSMYPYSERVSFGERTITATGSSSVPGVNNYIRNSVKATVDAYDGTVKLYVWDDKDPIIKAWRTIFPSLFADGASMPSSIREHVRYPEDLFRIQTYIYRQYHVQDPSTFFFRQDRWIIPKDPNKGEGLAALSQSEEIQPYYILMRLPESEKDEYILILPMNPKGKPNMVAYVAAKSGPEEYGKLADFRFPKTRQIFGVGQIHSRINQTEAISQELSLLDQRGSRVAFGNLLVIPIGKSILYVQPVFLQAEQNAIPELKFVILATSDKIVKGSTLEDALKQLAEGGNLTIGTPSTPGSTATSQSDLIKEALNHLIAAESAAKQGDWATYGREQQAAKDALEKANNPSPSPSKTPSPSPS